MKKKLLFIILAPVLLFSICILTSCDWSVYPDSGVYICEEPYIKLDYLNNAPKVSEMEYNGEVEKIVIHFSGVRFGITKYTGNLDYIGEDIIFGDFKVNNAKGLLYLYPDGSENTYILKK